MKKNIAVVGCGYWGKNLVRNFHALGSLAAVCDPIAEVASRYADQYQVKNYAFSEIVCDDSIEGVVLAVPAALHASMAIEAMSEFPELSRFAIRDMGKTVAAGVCIKIEKK